jgi:transcriptional regulator with XRE-family HTH domain
MLLLADQRRALGAFLRTRREALTPAAVGEPALFGGRRRTPGLRREEVAQLCGLSTTWYTWIEQGRDISLSPASLARLAAALRLTAAERVYLFDLTRLRDPAAAAPTASEPTPVPSALDAVLQAATVPAYLLDRLWSVRAWNPAASYLFAPWLGSREPCLLGYVFRDPTARRFICDWEDRARRLIAEFRADTAHHPEDPAMKALADDLARECPDFARLWDNHNVSMRDGGTRSFNHPKDGLLRYEQVTLVPPAFPDHKVVILLPITLAESRSVS